MISAVYDWAFRVTLSAAFLFFGLGLAGSFFEAKLRTEIAIDLLKGGMSRVELVEALTDRPDALFEPVFDVPLYTMGILSLMISLVLRLRIAAEEWKGIVKASEWS